MKIYNTLTREKEQFIPQVSGKVGIYACGPTVYNLIHIGNARPLCVFDALRRYLEYVGYTVTFVQNFTDIDDKIIKKAQEEGVEFWEIPARYIPEYEKDASGLNVRPADVHPKATEYIGQIIELIASLLQQGYAYQAGGDVYFRTAKDPEYGKLSRMPLEDLRAGARIAVGEAKEDPLDFALWKGAKPGEPAWPSPFGAGRPGWHIECSAMSRTILGGTIDIHCGGQDLIFPHHENEIAQSECACGSPLARYWMHNGYINVDNKKMSKSLGNFFTVREVAEKFGYEPIRYLMIASHYRSPINYSYEVMEQCAAAVERLHTARENIEYAIKNAPEEAQVDSAVAAQLQDYKQQFLDAMEDDLNTAQALSGVFDLAKLANILAQRVPSAGKATLEAVLAQYCELCGVLGLLYEKRGKDLDAEVESLIEERTRARAEKNYRRADEIRAQLLAMGIVLEDTKQGVKWHHA